MKIPFDLIIKESVSFFASQLPFVGSAYQIYDGVKKEQDIRDLVRRLEILESGTTSQDMSRIGLQDKKYHHFSGHSYTEFGDVYRSTNLILNPITQGGTKTDFFYKIFIEPESGPITWGEGHFGISLHMSNLSTGQPTGDYVVLLSNGREALFGILSDENTIIAKFEIRSSKVYEFTMGCNQGVLTCSVNKMLIYNGKSVIDNHFKFGFYMEKGSSINYDASIVM